MQPRAEITIDGKPLSGAFYGSLISLSITDELGFKSDTLDIVIDETRGEFDLPKAGAIAEVRLGFLETGLVYMGKFALDARSGSGPTPELSLSGTAIDFGSKLTQPQTRSWEAVTLQQIVDTLASEANLTPAVSQEIASTYYPFIAQSGESGLNLITRLAKPLDAAAKAADGRLLVAKLGTGKDVTGAQIEPISVARTDLTGWTWSEEEREKYTRVEAKWRDDGTGADRAEVAGSGAPSKTIREVFASQEEAQRAVTSALDRARRGDLKIECDGRWRPELFAGGIVDLSGLRSNLNGQAEVRSVKHSLRSTLTTSFSCSKSVFNAG